MIKLENISKKFGEQVIFDSISIELNDQIIKIKGGNGIGKSVLLKIIVGFSVPDEGKVYYGTMKELRKDTDFIEDAGVSINAPQFMNEWSGYENLKYLVKVSNKCSKERLNRLIEEFTLEHDIHKKYKTYSLGMRQKMRIIQALLDEPRYVIVDEPFDALDVDAKEKARVYLEQYIKNDSSRMLIYTSHTEEDDPFTDVIIGIESFKLIRIR